MFVPSLRAIQERCGYLPREEIKQLSARLDVPLHRLHEVISFFPHFRLEPGPEIQVQVCRDQACHLRGSEACRHRLEEVSAEFGGHEKVAIEGVSCLGRCDGAPAVLVELHRKGEHGHDRELLGPSVDEIAGRLREIVRAHLDGREPPPDIVDRSPRGWRIDPYNPSPHVPDDPPREPYAAVRAFAEAFKNAPDAAARKAVGQALIDTLKGSDLRGMGGAGRPAFSKWGEVRDESEREETTYVICNADESEPSTFKDREILLRAPHLIVEGMTLGALIVGARKGYVYVRHEYPEQIRAVAAEIERARSMGVVGANVLGTGHSFDLEAFTSPGGYVCGEQSALIEAIEEHRAEPRNRPPVIEANGLFNKPTLLNNVETFAWVPSIALRGAAWYHDSGITESAWYVAKRKPDDKPERWSRGRGIRFFSLCGDLERPGVFEVPTGTTLGELFAMAGGVRDGRELLAFAPSGPSGGLIPARLTPADLPPRNRRNFPAGRDSISLMELPLDKAEFDALGLLLGAGLLAIAAPPAGLGVSGMERVLDVALNATRFFRNESCGKCVPCRLGCQKLVMIGERLQSGVTTDSERAGMLDLIRSLQETMEQTSICSLGTSASKPLASLYEHDWSGGSR